MSVTETKELLRLCILGISSKTAAPGNHLRLLCSFQPMKCARQYGSQTVFVDGALFALGDLHTAMGDGEIGISGIGIDGKVTVTIDVDQRST